MQKLHFSIHINAPVEKVWDTMLGEETYKEWTKPFNPAGSTFVGSWDKGSEIKFVGKNPETGKEEGMLARIVENRPNEFISIEHYGVIMNGVEDTTSEEVKKWTPAHENYTLTEKDGGTELTIDVDVADEYKDMFDDMWPKSLDVLKKLSEEN